ncbi:class I alpha-mannosidase 1A [Purpureocillium lavendulum]|uniref:alpha-1,2-Mannosidase n=1 Tax=Purpureocillium lavendulum TaxID=1247861 RepID=A0AB34FPT0_9HYPO|nr:class I alpha-mannosidase 1A [Purpureocillium lavendulum]
MLPSRRRATARNTAAMLRRRYRPFAICAVVIVFLLYRAVQNSWDQQPAVFQSPPPPPPPPKSAPVDRVEPRPPPQDPARPQEPLQHKPEPVAEKPTPSPVEPEQDDNGGRVPVKIPTLKDDGKAKAPTQTAAAAAAGEIPQDHGSKVPRPKHDDDDEQPLRWKDPPKDSTIDVPAQEKKVHWTKPEEHFPLPKASVITLPTGAPKKLPKIQHPFGAETEAAKAKRLERLAKVKAELERSWSGYRKHAWMHDELSPVSGKYRDPFCGWSATLVDSLDTLWIAGMKDEFDEAAKAVKDIDFTHSDRHDIPVFETTIRYLGGLIAAYDVSGGAEGRHAFLLDKAQELAEILMGIFDTPNRMPVLYYQWRPKYASQPHMAGRVGVAELGTLSMEFTRLAQLTGQHKYYDAIDRITNALIDLQERGTLIPGLFPESLDASGCNRTATELLRDSMSQSAKDQVNSLGRLDEPQGFGAAAPDGSATGLNSVLDINRSKQRPVSPDDKLHRRAIAANAGSRDKSTRGPLAADGSKAAWDCVPQGLVPSSQSYQNYHVGGGQDSAYEYFPKEYLLLGGREPKYQKLYEDTADAVKEWLLFRPMTTGGWDVMFPAKVNTMGKPMTDLTPEYEVTHLSCFVGGMFGLGGKLFGRDKDVELAKKLTDGCVWAYQMMPSGIMPEYSQVAPCPSLDKCDFNQTRWYDLMDPSKDWRDERVRQWEEEQTELRRAQKTLSERLAPSRTGDESPLASSTSTGTAAAPAALDKRAAVPVQGQTKQLTLEEGSKLPESLRKKLGQTGGAADERAQDTPREDSAGSTGHPEKNAAKHAGKDTQLLDKPPSIPEPQPGRSGASRASSEHDSSGRPLSHLEWVEQKLARDELPKGFVTIPSPGYILRPEAIESVWYMYRITGDATWMDKGWAMFEATVRATRTSMANSAIANVLAKEPALKDEMESFWIAETLKYYYLLFSDPSLISLDEWVLNTEAHPFKL